MKSGSELIRARYLAAKKMYSRAYKLLLPLAPKYRHNYEYVYLVGVCAFGMREFDTSFEYLTTARDMASPAQAHDAQLYLAAIALTSRKTRKALEYWLAITAVQPNNPYALRGLKLLQDVKDDGNDLIARIAASPYRYQIVPPVRYPLQRLVRVVTFSAMALCALALVYGAVTGIRAAASAYTKIKIAQERRAIAEQIAAADSEQSGQSAQNAQNDGAGGDTRAELRTMRYPQYTALSPNAIRQTLRRIEENFIAYRDNAAAVDINTILHSNALPRDKRTAELFKENLRPADYASEGPWFSYAQVRSESWKYNGASVKWTGTVTQVQPGPSGMLRANFLTGFYGSSKQLEGTAPLLIPAALALNDGDEVEILGTIVVQFDETAALQNTAQAAAPAGASSRRNAARQSANSSEISDNPPFQVLVQNFRLLL